MKHTIIIIIKQIQIQMQSWQKWQDLGTFGRTNSNIPDWCCWQPHYSLSPWCPQATNPYLPPKKINKNKMKIQHRLHRSLLLAVTKAIIIQFVVKNYLSRFRLLPQVLKCAKYIKYVHRCKRSKATVPAAQRWYSGPRKEKGDEEMCEWRQIGGL